MPDHRRSQGEKDPKSVLNVIEIYTHDFFAERSSSAINVLGAEYAARSIIRDKHVYSL